MKKMRSTNPKWYRSLSYVLRKKPLKIHKNGNSLPLDSPNLPQILPVSPNWLQIPLASSPHSLPTQD
jgi:hypothetical protein